MGLATILRKSKQRPKDDNGYKTVLTPLPSSRPHSLTPSASRETLVPSNGCATSPFFTQLSAELRTQILEFAFGNRIVHMNLLFFAAKKPITWRAANATRHGGGYIDLGRKKKRKTDLYRFCGSVCHREPPASYGSRQGTQPCNDPCHRAWPVGGTEWCDKYKGEFPAKCFIGAMGFLRTCRQAYVEGIDVLYSTNTFHIESTLLAARLDSFVLRQRLERIRAVEMVWEFSPKAVAALEGNPTQATMREHYAPDACFRFLIGRLKGFLPHLRRLSISVNDNATLFWDVPLGDIERKLLRHVDSLLKSLPDLESFVLELPGSLYNAYTGEGCLQEWDKLNTEPQRVWRILKEQEEEKWSSRISGYWLQLGVNDVFEDSG